MEVILESLDKDDAFSIFKGADTFLTTRGEVCPVNQPSNKDTLRPALLSPSSVLQTVEERVI